MANEVKASCLNCKFAVFQDEGYSNYTVEGTMFHCALQNHPDGSFDRWYSEDPRLTFLCDAYEEGEPIEMDVDQDAISDLTPEQMDIYLMTEARPNHSKCGR